MEVRRHPVYDMPPPPPKDGWWETWKRSERGPNYKPGTDDVFWVNGYSLGRVYQHWDGRWQWASKCLHGGCGIEDTKEAAKRAVEAAADLDRLTEGCIPTFMKPAFKWPVSAEKVLPYELAFFAKRNCALHLAPVEPTG